MATRFYFPSTGAAPITPNWSYLWQDVSEGDRLKMVKTKISSSFVEKTCSENVSYYVNVANRMYVSDPIGAHDFTACDFNLQVRCKESNAAANFELFFILQILENDGTPGYVLRQWWLSGELETKMTNLGYDGTTAYRSSEDGDRLCIQIGVTATNYKTNNYTCTMDFGDNSGTDLPIDNTTTSQYNPWMEFSHDIPDAGEAPAYVPKIIMIT